MLQGNPKLLNLECSKAVSYTGVLFFFFIFLLVGEGKEFVVGDKTVK